MEIDKGTLIKALVAGVALYVIYRWLSPENPTSGQGENFFSRWYHDNANANSGVRPPLPPANQVIDPASAAASPAPPTVVLYTPDEWNYYREQEGKPIRDALQYPGVTPENRGSFRITKEQYDAWVGGLSGLNWGALGAMGSWKN